MKLMKIVSALLAAGAILWIAACSSMNRKEPRFQDYLVMAPPWIVTNKGFTHEQFKSRLISTAALIIPKGLLFGDEINEPTAGGSAFVLKHLTQTQVELLRSTFTFKPGATYKQPHNELFISPIRRYRTGDNVKRSFFSVANDPSVRSATSWGADAVVDPNGGTKITVAQTGAVPVLYVVDSGVQPIVPKTGGGYEWHNEFAAAKAVGVTPTMMFRQGRMPQGMGNWPCSGAPVPWNTAVDNDLNFSVAANVKPYLNVPAGCSDPQKDVIPHGSKIASLAVGATVGVVGRFKTSAGAPLKVAVQSIRIYSGATTTSANAVNGIYRAIAAKIRRKGPSVLLFANRSDAADSGLEVALWWAWKNGLVCVVSGGNEPGSADTTSIHVPNRMWYNATYSLPSFPTSPSRLEWNPANPENWPNPPDGMGGTIPRPDAPYLIMVGGDNLQYVSGAPDGNDGWRMTSSTYQGSSRGPEIDIIAPSINTPCANISEVTSYDQATTGTSMATGYVAGAAMVYLAANPTASPAQVRDWLMAKNLTSLTAAPCKQSHAGAYQAGNGGGNTSPYIGNATFGGYVPKLFIDNNTAGLR
jgi:Subtilase family